MKKRQKRDVINKYRTLCRRTIPHKKQFKTPQICFQKATYFKTSSQKNCFLSKFHQMYFLSKRNVVNTSFQIDPYILACITKNIIQQGISQQFFWVKNNLFTTFLVWGKIEKICLNVIPQDQHRMAILLVSLPDQQMDFCCPNTLSNQRKHTWSL